MTSKAVHFIQPFLLMSSLMAESFIQESWIKVPDLLNSKHSSGSGLWHVLRVNGVIQCGVVCGRDDHCNSFQYSFMTRTCSGFQVFRAPSVTDRGVDRGVVSYVGKVACPRDKGYLLHSTGTGTPLCFKYFMEPVKWHKARERCHSDGAELIVLDSEEKDALIVKYLNRYSGAGHITWVGILKEGKMTYKWLNNSTHIRWGVDEPDVHADQQCGQLDKGGMSDMYCYELRRFICEKHFT